MKNLIKSMAKAVKKMKFAFEDTDDQVATIPHVMTREEQDNDLFARVQAFNRVPLYTPTAQERKKEADTMRDLKDWVRRLSDNDRAIVMGRKPWEILNHIQGIVPIDGVVAQSLAASYDYAPTNVIKVDFEQKTKASFENTAVHVPKATTSFEARGLSQVSQELTQRGGYDQSMQADRKNEPTYSYEPPKPSAAFMAAHGKFA